MPLLKQNEYLKMLPLSISISIIYLIILGPEIQGSLFSTNNNSNLKMNQFRKLFF